MKSWPLLVIVGLVVVGFEYKEYFNQDRTAMFKSQAEIHRALASLKPVIENHVENRTENRVKNQITNRIVREVKLGMQKIIYTQQTVDGLPILPFGSGKHILPIQSSSDLLASIEQTAAPINKIQGDAESVWEKSRIFSTHPKYEWSRPIIWKQGSMKYAFEYYSRGVQVILDAENSELLFYRDRKKS